MSSTTDIHNELEKLGIGIKIRTLREEKQIQLEDLAQQIKITPVLLSQIEDNVVAPTVSTLLNISNILGVGIDHFFTKKEIADDIELTRVSERLNVPKSRETDSARLTYRYQALSYRLKGKKMEPFMVEFDAETDEKLEPLSHGGEEFIYCVQGEIEYITDKKRFTMRPGDSLYFYSRVPHVLRGVGPVQAKALAVLLPEES